MGRRGQGGLRGGDAAAAEGRSILAVVAERDRPQLATAIGRAADGQGDVAPIDATLVGDVNRSARFYVSAVEKDERDGEAAIIYAVETTEQRALEHGRYTLTVRAHHSRGWSTRRATITIG